MLVSNVELFQGIYHSDIFVVYVIHPVVAVAVDEPSFIIHVPEAYPILVCQR